MNLFIKVTSALQGRHTSFVAAFFVVGNVLHWLHRLDGTYIAFMSSLMGFVLGHSVKESMLPETQPDSAKPAADKSDESKPSGA
jgi:hypothetical protein